jgi:alginate O-acetyltransferase complex protein AlgI
MNPASLLNWAAFGMLIATYWLLPARARPSCLAWGSLLILGFNDFLAAALALFQISVCWFGASRLSRRSDPPLFWSLLAACLAPLALLKCQSILGIDAMQASGVLRIELGKFAVPMGISYLTFKALMYLAQTARRSLKPVGFIELAAYLAFAPAAGSGPIDEPRALLAQIAAPRAFTLDRLAYGLYRIVTGLVFKFVIADSLLKLGRWLLLPKILAVTLEQRLLFGPFYSLMLYFDFAGYSHIAIGAAYLLGIKCTENFSAPLLRANISEFWRCWHISLTTFLRGYVFMPAATRWSRRLGARGAAYAATILTFAVCGLWHGDGLNYLLWGLYHGCLLCAHQAFLHSTRRIPFWQGLRAKRWLAVPSWALTFLLVSYGWYLFAFSLPKLADIFLVGGGGA